MASKRDQDRATPAAGPLAGGGTNNPSRTSPIGGAPPPGALAPNPADRPVPERHGSEQMPRVRVTRRRVIASIVFVIVIVAFLYLGLPKLVGFGTSLKRLEDGDVYWLVAAAALEICSFAGYVALMRAVCAGQPRINWPVSYEITMAGLAATRLLATAGAGGIALTAWALRRAGMEARTVAARMVALMALLYGVYMAVLVLDGVGLYLGIVPGPAPFAMTIGPAILGAVIMLVFGSMALLPHNLGRAVSRGSGRPGVIGKLAQWLATVPDATATGIRTMIVMIRSKDPRLLGAPAWWAFDIATLWASFHAFGYAPHKGVIVMAYFVGWLANTLPLPGGIGGVEGGLIGAFTAFGVSVQAAVVAVLAYRAFSFWLPTIPGAIAYFRLRRIVHRWEDADDATLTLAGPKPQPHTA